MSEQPNLPIFVGSAPSREYRTGTRKMGWFRCSCGADFMADLTHVKRGKIRSCGCFRSATASQRLMKHGDSARGRRSAEYNTWANMIARCHNPNNGAFSRYGALGITVCGEWRSNYQAFLSHVGRRPSHKTSIDRIDSSKGYEPGNVRWATVDEQNNNKRSNIYVELNGDRLSLKDYCERVGLSINTVRYRLNNLNWPLSRAIERTDGRR